MLRAFDSLGGVRQELVQRLLAREGREEGRGGEDDRDDPSVGVAFFVWGAWVVSVPYAVPPLVSSLRVVRVKGKLPGNIDIVVRLFANNDSGYLYDLFLELFDQCQSTTINLRIFGLDKVGGNQTHGFVRIHIGSSVRFHRRGTYQVRLGARVPPLLAREWEEGAVVSWCIDSLA